LVTNCRERSFSATLSILRSTVLCVVFCYIYLVITLVLFFSFNAIISAELKMVTWVGVIREFFYIQMEKYARQALSEGMKNVSEMVVSKDDELYRVLVLHYNRNNQIEASDLCIK